MHDQQPTTHPDHPHLVVIPLDDGPNHPFPMHSCRATDPVLGVQHRAFLQDGLLTPGEVNVLGHIWMQREHFPQGMLVCMRCGISASCPICGQESAQEGLRVLCLSCSSLVHEVRQLRARLRLLLACLEDRRQLAVQGGEEANQ